VHFSCAASWDERLKELTDYRKITGIATFLTATAKTSVGLWVNNQRDATSAPRRKTLVMTPTESRGGNLGFQMDNFGSRRKTVSTSLPTFTELTVQRSFQLQRKHPVGLGLKAKVLKLHREERNR
jgi:hypothetical protein